MKGGTYRYIWYICIKGIKECSVYRVDRVDRLYKYTLIIVHIEFHFFSTPPHKKTKVACFIKTVP